MSSAFRPDSNHPRGPATMAGPPTPKGGESMNRHSAYAVLNCPVTHVLGLYDTEEEATTAAAEFGSCSFAYKLSEKESAALAAGE